MAGIASHSGTQNSVKKSAKKSTVTKQGSATASRNHRTVPKSGANQTDPNNEARRKRSAAKRKKRYDALFSNWKSRVKFRRPEISMGEWAGSGWHPSKLLSLSLVLGICGIIFWFHWDDRWFIYEENVAFDNLTYLQAEELYPLTELESWSLFWLQPRDIQEKVTKHPYIREAYVQPNLAGPVMVTVEEEYPVALWLTNDGTMWVLEDGTALQEKPLQNDQPLDGLLRILDRVQAAHAKDQRGFNAMDMNVLVGANTLMQLFPGLQDLRYDEGYGLNFALPGSSSIWVYWGDGNYTEDKLKNLEAARELLNSGNVSGNILDLRYPSRPYFRQS